MRAELWVDGDPLNHLVIVSPERGGGHKIGVGERPPAEPVEERGLYPGPEGVWVERIPLGVERLLQGKALRHEALAEVVGARGSASFGDVGGPCPQLRTVAGEPYSGRFRPPFCFSTLRVDR